MVQNWRLVLEQQFVYSCVPLWLESALSSVHRRAMFFIKCKQVLIPLGSQRQSAAVLWDAFIYHPRLEDSSWQLYYKRAYNYILRLQAYPHLRDSKTH